VIPKSGEQAPYGPAPLAAFAPESVWLELFAPASPFSISSASRMLVALDAAHRRTARQEAGLQRKITARRGEGSPAGVKKMLGTGSERTADFSGKTQGHREQQRRFQRTSSRPRSVGGGLGSTAGGGEGRHPRHGEGLGRLSLSRTADDADDRILPFESLVS